MKEPLKRGVSIKVVTRLAESHKEPERISECIKYLQSCGVAVQEGDVHQKFALIDNRLVWYGNINLLGYGKVEESIMRLDSGELAEELKIICI